MATLVLTAVGSAVGGALLPSGVSILGATVTGAALGGAVGGVVGSVIDQTLLAPTMRAQTGPRLKSVDITASTEGAGVTRLQGRSRLAGQIIWATRFEEEAREQGGGGGSKGGGGGGGGSATTFHYFANFAVGLCEGPVTRIGRIWADGKEVDQEEVTVRSYRGTESQSADPLIVAKEGAANAPAYRGLAYVVFDRLPLDNYGNRIPQITAEVFRGVGALEEKIEGVCIIPGTTEFGYEPDEVTHRGGTVVPFPGGSGAAVVIPGTETRPENRHTLVDRSNWRASMRMLGQLAPNVETALLVVAWFGSDLRCGLCEIKPKVEGHDRETRKGAEAFEWLVAGLSRGEAELVSFIEDRPAYGGAPNDRSVIAAIQDLKARGYFVVFYPFVMMDIAPGNALPDPYSDDASQVGQPPHPWRGRITCSPAPGFAGSPDKTGAAADQVAGFMGEAQAADFLFSVFDEVDFQGDPDDWGYARFVLHMAKLCELAGGVDGFCIGSEMRGLTSVRDGATSYPFVAALRDLAGEVRGIVGPATRIGYAADWSEYHSHRPDDGSGDVIFHLDPLWADEEIDFVGIDNYLPMSDWRDGTEHLDYHPDGPTTIYDQAYLKANIEGGEYYDWFYPAAGITGNEPSPERIAQARTPIEDTQHGEPWVFGNKDIRNWWQNAHHNRPGGVREASSTEWVPQAKPVWFTEVGCPAVDKGANQPNVFHDPKSSESFFPYFSSGMRDDAMQRAFLEAFLDYWGDSANNPVSSVYSGRMIDMARTCVWAWDARMVPSFPDDERTWADGPNWETGHWISGRLGAAPARETLIDILDRAGMPAGERLVEPIGSVVDAVMADRILSPRAMIESLSPVHLLKAHESGSRIVIGTRLGQPTRATIALNDLVEDGEADRFRKTRAQETDLPAIINLSYGEPTADDLAGGVRAIRQITSSQRTVQVTAPVVMPAAKAQSTAETMLRDAWWGREALDFTLPPSMLALEPGDVIRFEVDGDSYRLGEIADGLSRRCRAGRAESDMVTPAPAPRRARAVGSNLALGPANFAFIDGPLLRDSDDPHAVYVAAFMTPWQGGVAFYRSPGETGFVLDTYITVPAAMGVTAFDFFSGPVWRWDRGNELWVDLLHGQLNSADDLAVLGGANALAVLNGDGEWEVLQFAEAELMDVGRYRLTRLLRGQRGTEYAMRDPVAAGAPVVVLDQALRQTGLGADETGLALNWRVGPTARDVGDATYQALAVTIEARALRPYAPARVDAVRPAGTDDIVLRWVRRTRIGGDGWAQEQVPLGEESERYDVEILDGGDVVRTISGLDAPTVTYSAAQQSADFGAPIAFPDSLSLRVYQRSASFGRGMPLEATLFFPLPVETT